MMAATVYSDGLSEWRAQNKGCVQFSFKILKILQDSPSQQIFGCMHGALNIDKKINYTIWL
jgi:hypothetical protein